MVREKGVVNAVRTVCYSRDQDDLRDLKEEMGNMSAVQVRLISSYYPVDLLTEYPFSPIY